MTYETRSVTTTDGLGLFVRDYAARGSARGLPVICLHGLTRNSADFEDVAPRIASLGRRVLVPDVRGRGRSDRDPMHARYVPTTYAADVIHTLNTLGVAAAVFIGTSMGGLITMIVAAMAPGRVRAAVLNDIGPVVNPSGIARVAQYVGKIEPVASWDAMADLIRSLQGVAFPDADDAFWRVLARRVARELPDGRVAFDYDLAITPVLEQPREAAVPDLTPLFQALAPVPLLVVHGVLSDILVGEGIAAMRALRDDLEVAEVPRVGHAPTLEEPEAWRAVADFLARVA